MNAPLASHTIQAKALADHLREHGFLDDEDLIADTIEGETDAMEAVSRLLRWLGERNANAAALKSLEGEYATRRKRFEEAEQSGRKAIAHFMAEVGLSKIERPEATVSVRPGGVTVVYSADFDPAALPDDLVRTKREADKPAVKAALEGGREIAGATLSNSPPVLTIRTK